jgi:hypothetical protein
MTIERLQSLSFKGLTRFNGFELLAWDFNPRWAMQSSIITQIEFASSITNCRLAKYRPYRTPSLPSLRSITAL